MGFESISCSGNHQTARMSCAASFPSSTSEPCILSERACACQPGHRCCMLQAGLAKWMLELQPRFSIVKSCTWIWASARRALAATSPMQGSLSSAMVASSIFAVDSGIFWAQHWYETTTHDQNLGCICCGLRPVTLVNGWNSIIPNYAPSI